MPRNTREKTCERCGHTKEMHEHYFGGFCDWKSIESGDLEECSCAKFRRKKTKKGQRVSAKHHY